MNKVEVIRYGTLAKTLLKDNELYSQQFEGKTPLTPATLTEIITNAKLLHSLGHVSNFYSDELFFRIKAKTSLDLSKYPVEQLSLKMIQQIVTQCLSKS